jgi:hypothetical protein
MYIINSSTIQNYLYVKSIFTQVIQCTSYQCRECTIIGFPIFLIFGAEFIYLFIYLLKLISNVYILTHYYYDNTRVTHKWDLRPHVHKIILSGRYPKLCFSLSNCILNLSVRLNYNYGKYLW